MSAGVPPGSVPSIEQQAISRYLSRTAIAGDAVLLKEASVRAWSSKTPRVFRSDHHQ
jgi:hypothetical protein